MTSSDNVPGHRVNNIPKYLLWKRLHSLTGLFLVLYLIEHLLVNSQAALMFGEDGVGFVKAVNKIHDLPYLPFIEFFLIGVPIVIHASWGIKYLQTGRPNSYGSTNAAECYLPEYPRNHAYTWQRITSWVLLFLIAGHVIQMRFLEYPLVVKEENKKKYYVRVQEDQGLGSLSKRLDFQIQSHPEESISAKMPLRKGEVLIQSDSFGMAELIMVRETFKSPLMLALYTLLVLSACFHAFNGLWTFMISWGVTLTQTSQKWMRRVANFIMIVVAFWGLAAIFGTYWINLKQ